MPVYRQHKLFHIHIPRTGGTAIGQFFESAGDMVWNRDSWVGQQQIDGRWYEFQHLTFGEFNTLTGARFNEFQPFAVLRNPYHRLLSDFIWRLQVTRQFPGSAVRSFDSFASFIAAIPDDFNTNWRTHIQGASKTQANFLIHVRPQSHYIAGATANRPVKLLAFERLDQDFAQFMAPFGGNTSPIKAPSTWKLKPHFDQPSLDRVSRIYADDFKLGGYRPIGLL